jgi:hypothetical protein
VKEGGELFFDNTDGPVTIYVTGHLVLDAGGMILTASSDPERLAFYLANDAPANLSNGAGFHGVVYGPGAAIKLDNGGTFRGALVGDDVEVANESELHYYAALHRNDCRAIPPELTVPTSLSIAPGQFLTVPVPLVDALAGWQVRLGDREVPIEVLDSLTGILVPPDLAPGARVELALVDPNGCRSRRTVLAEVSSTTPACGLLGIELALVPLAAAWQRRRRS